MTRKKPVSFTEGARQAAAEVSSPQADTTLRSMTVRVMYHKGPSEIGFYRRQWRRGVAQTIPVADWVAMNNRPDVVDFNFSEVIEET